MSVSSHQPAANSDTRRRLLEAGGEIFAQVGFRDATVRDICTKADANIAAVNYHFGDKQGLYHEVFRFARICSQEKHPISAEALAQMPPEAALAEYIRGFLARIFDQGRHAWLGRLVAREMAEPTGVLDELVRDHIRPQMMALTQILTRLLNMPVEDPAIMRCASSVVGQCLHYFHARPVLGAALPADAIRIRRDGRVCPPHHRVLARGDQGDRRGRGCIQRRSEDVMNLVALKMLMGDKAKYIGIIIGLTFASLLITQQAAIFIGLMTRTFGFITDTGLPDIWVMDPKVQFVDDISRCRTRSCFVSAASRAWSGRCRSIKASSRPAWTTAISRPAM